MEYFSNICLMQVSALYIDQCLTYSWLSDYK